MTSEITTDFSTVEQSPEPTTLDTIKQHVDSSHKVTTSLFKDLENGLGKNAGTLCCVGVVIACIVLIIYFV